VKDKNKIKTQRRRDAEIFKRAKREKGERGKRKVFESLNFFTFSPFPLFTIFLCVSASLRFKFFSIL